MANYEGITPNPSPHYIDIFDSGATTHMTPYQDRLFNIREIPRQPIRAANSQTFNATAVGEMRIQLP
ncbi:hypothetical protein BDN72DRAFT_782255, partial [Pluteus cervinus]